MPTIGVYVPIGVARSVASRWGITTKHEDFQELVRILCAEALEDAAGIGQPDRDFDLRCAYSLLHKSGYRCRHCGGS